MWLGSSLAGANAGEKTSVPETAHSPAIPAYVARPAGTSPAAAVLVLAGCEGYNERYAAIADWLAAHGFVGVAIDALAPLGMTNACSDRSGSREEAGEAVAALAWMRSQSYIDGARMALLGYSMGGIAVLDIVDPGHSKEPVPGLLGAVAYYPACRNRTPENIALPLRILDGADDDWTPPGPCQTLARAAASAGKNVTITTYPGATHAFNVNEPNRESYGHHLRYDAAATADSERQTLEFLRATLHATP